MHAIKDRRCSKLLLAAAVIAWAAWGTGVPSAFAQAAHPPGPPASETPRANAPRPRGRPPPAQNDNSPRLPASPVPDPSLELPGPTLRFTATAGAIPLLDAESLALQAEVAYVAYTMGSPAERPVTFLFNGGPGAASAYLDIG